MKLIVVLVAIAMSLVSCGADIKSDEGKFSYAVGYEIGRNMKRQDVKINYSSFMAAMKDVMGDKKIKMTDEERRNAMRKMVELKKEQDKKSAEANKEKASKFLEENKTKPGIKTTESGVQYQEISPGSGAMPKPEDTVSVRYKGSLIDGTEFDSSYKRKKPAEFPLNAVIPGWTEALQLMKEGSKYKIFIPPQLGYGERGSQRIPGNSVLIFEVELLKVIPKKSKQKTGSKSKSKKKG